MGCAQPVQPNCQLCGYLNDTHGKQQHNCAQDLVGIAPSGSKDIGNDYLLPKVATGLNGHDAGGLNGHEASNNGEILLEGQTVAQQVLDVSDDLDNETANPTAPFRRRRGFGVCAESIKTGYYKPPYWVKHQSWETALFEALSGCVIFKRFSTKHIWTFVHTAEVHLRFDKEIVAEQGGGGDALMVLFDGVIDFYRDDELVKSVGRPGTVINPTNVLWKTPNSFKLVARDEVTFAKLGREEFMNLSVRQEVYKHGDYEELLKNTEMLETMDYEGIAKLADCATVRSYGKGKDIVRQGEEGDEFYVMLSGAATAWKLTGKDDKQDVKSYVKGGLFGELALINDEPRQATVTCTEACEVLCFSKAQFERMLCPMNSLKTKTYLTDPRKLIADFYEKGDSRGPMGTLKLKNLNPEASLGVSNWFAVYRPTSRDAIMKMLSGLAVGKGLNVKGKSAKQGVLSGFVPFCQISDSKHKPVIEKSPPNARLLLYYKSEANRRDAVNRLTKFMEEQKSRLDIQKRQINLVNDYEPLAFGLDLPEPLLREAYIMDPPLEPPVGWETGRRSEPAFMDMNMHAVRDPSQPKVVLYQYDESDPMNPRGLLIAYAEQFVKPVVSDFDTFCVGSKGMAYAPLPPEQCELVVWCLNQTQRVLKTLEVGDPWTSRWLSILAEAKKEGFHPELPKYGFGDPVSYELIADVVKQTETCGAVRHGAECCNFYFPQELDDEFLVVWSGFPDKPWMYYSEEQVRKWLKERAQEGFSIPLNPVWPVRDPGWYEVLQVLRDSEEAKPALAQWYPGDILDRIDKIHAEHPKGFTMKG